MREQVFVATAALPPVLVAVVSRTRLAKTSTPRRSQRSIYGCRHRARAGGPGGVGLCRRHLGSGAGDGGPLATAPTMEAWLGVYNKGDAVARRRDHEDHFLGPGEPGSPPYRP